MKTAFRKPPEWHGDEGTLWGYVNLSHVTHFVIDTGEIGFVGGATKVIAEPQHEEMAKALEEFEKPMLVDAEKQALAPSLDKWHDMTTSDGVDA